MTCNWGVRRHDTGDKPVIYVIAQPNNNEAFAREWRDSLNMMRDNWIEHHPGEECSKPAEVVRCALDWETVE